MAYRVVTVPATLTGDADSTADLYLVAADATQTDSAGPHDIVQCRYVCDEFSRAYHLANQLNIDNP